MQVFRLFLLIIITITALAGILFVSQQSAKVDVPNPSPTVTANP